MQNQKDICREFELSVPEGAIKCEPETERVIRVNFFDAWNFWADEKAITFDIGAYADMRITHTQMIFRAMVGDEIIINHAGYDIKVDEDGVTLYIWLKE